MQLALGILLLVSFLVFIVYAAKGGNLMMGLFVMAVLWCAIGAIGGVVTWEDINTTVFNQGPLDFGSTAVNIIFGSWFGRILVETGIAGTIIRKAVELGGDKPGLTTSLLCIVTTAIFTTAYGVGAVIAIGVIVFPILLSLGISKPLAAAAYTMSVGAGLYFNSSLLNQAAGVMVVNDEQYTFGPEWYRFAAVALAIHLLGVILMVLIGTRKGAKSHAWAASAGSMTTEKNVNLLACLTPIIPVTISIAFGVQSIPAIIIAVIWALAWTGYFKSWNGIGEVVQKTFHDGVSDVGLVLAFLMFLQMFNKSAGLVNELLKPIVAPHHSHKCVCAVPGFRLAQLPQPVPRPAHHLGRRRGHVCHCGRHGHSAAGGAVPAVLYPEHNGHHQLLPHAKLEYVGHWLHQNQHPRLHEADAGICAAHCTDFGDCRLLYVCVNTVRPQLPEACRHTGMPEQERFTVKLK